MSPDKKYSGGLADTCYKTDEAKEPTDEKHAKRQTQAVAACCDFAA